MAKSEKEKTVTKTTKKTAEKKTAAKSTAAKKVVAKKPAAKAAPSNANAKAKADKSKKAGAKKPAVKATTEKKVEAKKAVPKKVVAKKPAVKAVAEKKVEAKKVEAKKPAVKAAAKKPVAKKSTPKKKSKGAPVGHGVGRRKASVARVWLRKGKGVITINDRSFEHYFDTDSTRLAASTPMRLIPQASEYDISVNVSGGGLWGQADAVKLGISRALVKIHDGLRPELRKLGLLTVDSRLKERKKPGQPGARRKFQFVKR